jgi:hypothetical protein
MVRKLAACLAAGRRSVKKVIGTPLQTRGPSPVPVLGEPLVREVPALARLDVSERDPVPGHADPSIGS